MTYGEIIRELFKRSECKTNQEYADIIGFSPTHLGQVLDGKAIGSHRMLIAALQHAKPPLTLWDCLGLPEKEADTKDEKEIVRLFRRCEPPQRDLALQLLNQLAYGEIRQRRHG